MNSGIREHKEAPMTSVGSWRLVEPGAGVSVELGLGRPTIKVGAATPANTGRS